MGVAHGAPPHEDEPFPQSEAERGRHQTLVRSGAGDRLFRHIVFETFYHNIMFSFINALFYNVKACNFILLCILLEFWYVAHVSSV